MAISRPWTRPSAPAEVFDSWPWPAAFAVLFVIVALRSNLTYWAGRGLRTGGDRTRFARHLDRPAVQRAERAVNRWGAPLVALSFLTVGVQTAVNAAAGATRMPLRRYLPANVIGCLAWATLYVTVGLAVVEAWVGRGGWWWVLVLAGVVAVVVVVNLVVRRRPGIRDL